MREKDKFELLKDLARLIGKYGPEAFTELAAFLRKPDAVDEVVQVLEATSLAGRKAGMQKRPSHNPRAKESVEAMVAEIATTDPTKAAKLAAIHQALASKRLLPTLGAVRDFASDNGLRPIAGRSRERALLPLMRDISARPIEDIDRILERAESASMPDDRGLEGWAGIILGQNRNKD
jgi:hypothetical protein